MPKEEDVQQSRDDEAQRSNDPDHQREQHGEVNDSLPFVAVLNHNLDVEEELIEARAVIGGMISYRQKLGLHDGIQGHGVDSDARPLSNDDKQGALELEVYKEGNVVGALFTLGQLGKDQEASPALTSLGHTHALEDNRQRVEIALCYASRAHNAHSHDPSIYEEDVGNDDGNGEDPFGHFERNLGLDLTRPLVESEKVDSSEGIGGVDSAGDEYEYPQPTVGDGCKARGRPKIREGL